MPNQLSTTIAPAGQSYAASNGIKIGDGAYHQSVRVFRAVFNGTVAQNDTIELVRNLPAGLIFLYGLLAVPVSFGATATFRIGEGTIASTGAVTYTAGARGTYRAAATLTANEVFQAGLVTELAAETTGLSSVFCTVAAAGITPVAGTNPFVCMLFYATR
jgi:hypothetical protein